MPEISYENKFFGMVDLLNQQYGEYLGVLAGLSDDTPKEQVSDSMNIIRSTCVQVLFLGVGLGVKADDEMKKSLKEGYLKLTSIEAVLEWANSICASKSKEGVLQEIMGASDEKK